MKKIRVAINGFGRIGRAITRTSIINPRDDIEIAVINVGYGSMANHYHLLKYDSVHGKLSDNILKHDNESYFTINSDYNIKLIAEPNIENLDWLQHDIDIVLECSGIFNNQKSYNHIRNGARGVIISAPAKDVEATIVCGVNEDILRFKDYKVISAASCTTNCLAPIAKIVHELFQIESGFATTVHSYTNDQRIVDTIHQDKRRARASNLSIIPTTTGAAVAIGEVIPDLIDKIQGAALRVPIPNVSLLDFTVNCAKKCDMMALREAIFYAENHHMKNIIKYCNEELVSIDFNGTSYSAIYDATQTVQFASNSLRIVAWYDNEYGFANRMLDLCGHLIKGKVDEYS